MNMDTRIYVKQKTWFSRRGLLLAFVTLLITPAAAQTSQNSYLLPKNVVPEHYDVELQPFLHSAGNFSFKGQVRMKVLILEDTDQVIFHVKDLTVHQVTVQLATSEGAECHGAASGVEVISRENDSTRDFYILNLQTKLVSGQRYEIFLTFDGTLNDQDVGFYRNSYSDHSGVTKWLATTQFQPTDARRAFPCFDEPALKATFSIILVRWHNMTSLSNMPTYKTEERDEDWVADHYETTVRMSTYLLAFVVSDFKGSGTSKFSVWSREEVINSTAYAVEVGPKMLSFYEDFFGLKYPLPKTDIVAIPDFAGGMENWGLLIFQETNVLYDEQFSPDSDKQQAASVISHELAHQWFGNLVTPKWWDDLWLNEGFATYVQYLGVASIHPDWQMDQQFVLNTMQDVMDIDSLKTSHPISLPVGHPDEINEIFDKISYYKGASIIRMMKFFLGEQNFRTGLTNYLNDLKYGSAVQDDLWKFMTAVMKKQGSNINVKTVMDSWTLQTGFPVVTITRDYATGTATVQQNRFLIQNRTTNSTDNPQWEIPLSYTDGRNPNWEPETKLWLHKTNGELSGLPSHRVWIVVNVQEAGYYRVNYDRQNWRLLIKQLQKNHMKIHPINRAQILDDAFDLARGGLLRYALVLNSTIYLRKEKDYLPWKAALKSFEFIEIMIRRTDIYGKWKEYIVGQLQPMYDMLGWKVGPDENILQQYLRVSVLSWMCAYEHDDCIKTALEKYNLWKEDIKNVGIIPTNFRSTVYCAAIKFGGLDDWDFMWEQYKLSQIASEKSIFMYALTCSEDPWILSRYLNWTLQPESGLGRRDGANVFSAIGETLYGQDLAFRLLRDEWNVIYDRYGKAYYFFINKMVKTVTASLNTPSQLTQLKELYEENVNHLGSSRMAFQQSIENVESNVMWMKSNYGVVRKWLNTVR